MTTPDYIVTIQRWPRSGGDLFSASVMRMRDRIRVWTAMPTFRKAAFLKAREMQREYRNCPVRMWDGNNTFYALDPIDKREFSII